MSHSKPTSICFTAMAGLVLFLVVVSSTAPLVNKRQAVNVESERNITKQIFIGMRLINEIDSETARKASDQNVTLSLQVLCNMYNLYRDYTNALSSYIQPDHRLHATYSAAQFVAWEAMQSACQWVTMNSSSNVLRDDGCALNSIARTCQVFHVKTMVTDFQERVRSVSTVDHNLNLAEWRPYVDGLTICGADIINSTITSP